MTRKQRNFFNVRTWRPFAAPPEQGADAGDVESRERSHPAWASRWMFVAVFCVGALLRLGVALQDQLIHVDGAFQYIPAARMYYEGGFKAGLQCIQMPLYPWLIALLAHPLGGDLETAARVISLLAGIAAMLPLYFLGRLLFGYRVAIASMAIYAVSPLMVTNSSEVAKESLFAALFLTGLWLGWLAVTRLRWYWCMAAGATAAVAYLCRPDGVDLFLLWAVWLGAGVVRHLWRERRQSLVRIAAGLIIAGTGAVFAGPYLWFIHEASGQWSASMKKPSDQMVQGFPGNRVPEDTPFINRLGIKVGRSASALGEIGREIFNELTAALFAFMMIGLFYRGLRLVIAKDRYLMLVCLIQLGVCYLIARNLSNYEGIRIVASNFSGRHLLSMLLAAWFWMGWGFVALEGGVTRLVNAVRRRWGGGSAEERREDVRVGLIMLILLLVTGAAVAFEAPRANKLPRKQAGVWLREHGVGADAKIITNARRIAYYAGLSRDENILRPTKHWLHRVDALVTWARERDADYLAIIGDELDAAAEAQLAGAVEHGKLEYLHRTEMDPEEDIHLYRVLPAEAP